MIKIVHFLPSLNNTSGIANMIMNYYREIDKKNFKFYFIYFCDDHDKNFKKEIENFIKYAHLRNILNLNVV